jgi:formylglycine-generating enzyme required for sulfatase activity
VSDTGYETDAERFGWSFVFHLFLSESARSSNPRVNGAEWWIQVPGASWRAPMGPDSEPVGSHPVVHVSWNDATTFAAWAGKRLPTEAEWEYAARAGFERAMYPWGDDFPSGRAARANIFEGEFPNHDTGEDGYTGTAPAKSYDPNRFGLYNMVGNVWEWTADWFGIDHQRDDRADPTGPPEGVSKVIRGGSYLCHDSYCNRYRVSARTSATPDSSTGNTGFRLARDVATA